MKLRSTMIRGLALVAAILVSAATVQAESLHRPVSLIIPLGAGGSHDLIARVITSTISPYLGQPMTVRLMPGEAGAKGTAAVAAAPPDGHTLLFTQNYFDMMLPQVQRLPYEPLRDLVPVVQINSAPVVIVVRADSPYRSFAEMLELARREPGRLRFGHSGMWGPSYMPASQIMQDTGIRFTMVPFNGGGPSIAALQNGEVDVSAAFPSNANGLIQSGRLRAIATGGRTRIYADVPTFAELGIADETAQMRRVVLAPTGTPKPILAALETAFLALNADPTFLQLMERLGETVDMMPGLTYQAIRQRQNDDYRALANAITN